MDQLDALYDAAIAGDAAAIANLKTEADILNDDDETILHIQSRTGNAERVRFILKEFAKKYLLAKLTVHKHTALHLAAHYGHTEVAEAIIEASRQHFPESAFQAFLRRGDRDNDIALHVAVMEGNIAIVKILVEADPTETYIQNNKGKTPMDIAVEKGLKDIVEIISNCRAPFLDGYDGSHALHINNVDQDALYDAAIAGDAAAIAKLKTEADILNDDDETILHIQSRNGNTERVRFILRVFANKNLLEKVTKNKRTALHLALYEGHTKVAEVIIEASRQHLSEISFQVLLMQADKDNNTALHIAVMEGNIAIVKLLVEADDPTEAHIQNNEGKTPMYIAVEKGFRDIVEMISTNCTAPSLDGPDGSTAMHINNLDQVKSQGRTFYTIMDRDALYAAAIAGDADAIANLGKKAYSLGSKNKETILHIESKSGNTERVRFILREFAKKNLLVKLGNQKETALIWAACMGHTEVVEVLIEAARHLRPSTNFYSPITSFQGFIRHADEHSETALHYAVINGHVAIVKLLVEADPTDKHIQNNEGKTPMYKAVELGYNNIVEIISTTCTAPSRDGPDGSAALLIDNLDHVKSPDGTLYKIMDRDALFAAAIDGNADAIANLEKKADLLNEYEETILHIESKIGNTERVRFILREFANKNLLVKLGNQKETALIWAAFMGHTQVVEVLIEAARHLPPSANDNPITSFQAFLRHADQDSHTALHVAVMNGHVAIVKLLVEADPTDKHLQNDDGKTPMYIAVELGYKNIVEIISTTCTAPSLDGPDVSTAMRVNNLGQVKSPGEILFKIMDRDALYAAAIAGDADAIAKLGKEANTTLYKEGYTILHIESIFGNAAHVRFILTEFANKNLLVKVDNDQQQTALVCAAYIGHTEVVEILIDAAKHFLPPSANGDSSFQAFLRKGNKHSDTALHAAVIEGHLDVVKLLVEADPTDRHFPNKQGKTPMYIAVEKGFNDIVEIISTTCTAPSFDGPDGSTVLHNAFKNHNQNTEVIEVLIDAARRLPFSANFRRVDKDFNTALHIAVMQGDLATAKLLVAADPSCPSIENKKGETPFYIAAERGYADILKMMCTTSTSAESNLYGPVGLSPLHAVIKNLDEAKNEVRDMIKITLDMLKQVINSKDKSMSAIYTYYCFPRIFSKTDEYGQTVLELAVERNYLTVVELILDFILDYQSPVYDRTGKDLISLVPLIYKAENEGNKNMAKLLSDRYEAGDNLYVSRDSLILISAIRRREADTVFGLLDGLHFESEAVTIFDNSGWTSLHHAAYHEFDSIIHAIIEAQKKFGHKFVYDRVTPFHVAAKRGYTSTVILLMQLWPSSSSAYINVDQNGQNILHLAALQSKKEMIQGVLKYCPEELKNELVNKKDTDGNTPLHLLIRGGCLVPELLRYKGLDITMENNHRWTPRDMLYLEDRIIDQQVQIKIALDDIHIDQRKDIFSSPVLSSKRDAKDAILCKKGKLMIQEKHSRIKEDTHAFAICFADAIAGDGISKGALEMEADILNKDGKNILHVESMRGDTERVRFIVREFANKNILVKLDTLKQSALHLAAHHGRTQVVEALIEAARHLPSSDEDDDAHYPVSSLQDFIRQATGIMRNTALHLAVLNCNVAIVKLLVQADPNDNHVRNNEGKTPIYIAAEKGYKDIVKEICTTCTALSLDGPDGSTTALHAAIVNIEQEKEEDNLIRMMMDAAKRWGLEGSSFEALFRRTNDSGSTVLKLAVDRNYVHVVAHILQEDPAYQHGRCGSINNAFMRLIYTAIDRKYEDILMLLRETYEAQISVDHKGMIDLIVAIRRRHRVTVIRLLEGNKKLVTFADEDGWTALHHAAYHQFDSILDAIIEAQIEVGHEFVYKHRDLSTPFHVAAEKGYTFTVIRLMELWPTWSSAYTDVNNDGRNILHLAATQSEKEMIQGILKYCPEKYKNQIVNAQDNNGDTPLHLLIMLGCFVPELIKCKGLHTMTKNKSDHTPLDYFYLEDGIIADQEKLKIALDDIETDQYRKFWRKNIKRKSNYLESVVLPSRRKAKDMQFEIAKKNLMEETRGQMKKDLERYKKRTSTQIVVTALITTVTFTVGFTMPGGLYQSGDVNQGLVVLSRKKAFNAFMVSDAIALLLSTCSLFLYFLESMYEDPRQVSKLNAASTGLNIVSVMAMMLTFITGTYVVLSHSLALAITVSIIGSFFFVFVIVLMIKMVYDREVKRNED